MRTPLRARRVLAPAYAHLPLLDADMVAVGTRSATTATRCGMTSSVTPYRASIDFRPALGGPGIPCHHDRRLVRHVPAVDAGGLPGAARRRADPTPAVGGTSSSFANAGPKDNQELERRPDVLTYTSEPLRSPLVITGPVTAELFASSNCPHADFFARLCDVDPKGKSVNITDGLIRLTSASPQPQQVRADLWPTAHQFRPGHRIRLQVSSGAHPRLRPEHRQRNTGSGEPLATAATLCTAQQGVYHDPEHPSAILLPVVTPG